MWPGTGKFPDIEFVLSPGCQPISSRFTGGRKTEVFAFRFLGFFFFLRSEANLYSFYNLIGILRKEMMRIGGWDMPRLWEPG